MATLVQQYFVQSAKKYPTKIAVSCGEESLTFEELDLLSSKLATHLQQNNISKGSFVPFFMQKSIESIISILGVLKAGCAYVPIDVNSPSQRIESILQATKSPIMLVNDDSSGNLNLADLKNTQVELVNVNDSKILELEAEVVESDFLSVDIAYVLFTSGSTGTPKGVMIPHKAIIDYIDWCVDEYQLSQGDVISNHAPLYFDNSTFDIYTAFKTGATLKLVPDSLNAVLPRLVKWLSANEITTFFCVPSVLTMLLKSRRLKPESFPNLRHIICAGEVLPPHVLREWMLLYPNIQFTNMYGPTEITVDCSYHIQKQLPPADCDSIPIGVARKNMELFIRLANGNLTQEAGAQGELLVRGTSVAYGYLGLNEKTKATFLQNPNHDLYHDPLYCTGDMVRIDEELQYHFVGRLDDQIKYLGYRIELGEIESIINSLVYVDEAVVVFRKESDIDSAYIGLLVNCNKSIDSEVLTADLKLSLPSYMVPSVIVQCEDEFPRTANGKYDRKAALKLIQ